MRVLFLLSALAFGFTVGGCAHHEITDNFLAAEAKVTETTHSYELLRSLPPASQKATVAVYSFDDQTGQFKSSDKVTEYSSAVTKGGLAILNNALLAAGNKGWFTVVERGGLKNVIQERQIIRAMRQQYETPDGRKLPDVQPLAYAGMLIEGGIIAYDTNTLTGGAAASYFGIGGNSEYRSDRVAVYLRAVHVATGEVVLSVTSTKTVYSVSLQGNVFKYLSTDRILQAETGFTMNEPVQLAVRQAIETGVYSLIMEGAAEGVWGFADPVAGQEALKQYLERKAGDSVPEANIPQPPSSSPSYAPVAPLPPRAEAPAQAKPEYAQIVPQAAPVEMAQAPKVEHLSSERLTDAQLAQTPPVPQPPEKTWWSALFGSDKKPEAQTAAATEPQPTPAPVMPAPVMDVASAPLPPEPQAETAVAQLRPAPQPPVEAASATIAQPAPEFRPAPIQVAEAQPNIAAIAQPLPPVTVQAPQPASVSQHYMPPHAEPQIAQAPVAQAPAARPIAQPQLAQAAPRAVRPAPQAVAQRQATTTRPLVMVSHRSAKKGETAPRHAATILRPANPRVLVKYLDESRYAQRHAVN